MMRGKAGPFIASLFKHVLRFCSAWRLIRRQQACPRQHHSWNTPGKLGMGGDKSCSAVPKESLNTAPNPLWASRPRSAQEPSQAPRDAPASLQTPSDYGLTSLVPAISRPCMFLLCALKSTPFHQRGAEPSLNLLRGLAWGLGIHSRFERAPQCARPRGNSTVPL